MTKTTPLFIVAGLDSDGRPHAARFAPTEQGPAAKAAAVMGFRIGEGSIGQAARGGARASRWTHLRDRQGAGALCKTGTVRPADGSGAAWHPLPC